MNNTKNIHEIRIVNDTYHLQQEIIDKLDNAIELYYEKYSYMVHEDNMEFVDSIIGEINQSDSPTNILKVYPSYDKEYPIITMEYKSTCDYEDRVIPDEIIEYIKFRFTYYIVNETLKNLDSIRIYTDN